jgi:hypothetical protein
MENITNEAIGISGEHIADYICVERFKWGQWSEHDQGAQGRFKVKPDRLNPGKLSKGGSPKSTHKLYRLSDGANGTGIDAVWRAEGHNHGKPYAIVEAKATRDEDAPKFMRRLHNTRMPGIASTLGVNAITDPSELIEPLEEDADSRGRRTSSKGSRAKKGKAGGSNTGPQKPAQTKPGKGDENATDIKVQMSHEWIRANIEKAVSKPIALEILEAGRQIYSRHIFFSPAYHPSGSPKAHMHAKLGNSGPGAHADHDAFHYGESEVKTAVNKRKARLRNKYGSLLSLKEER